MTITMIIVGILVFIWLVFGGSALAVCWGSIRRAKEIYPHLGEYKYSLLINQVVGEKDGQEIIWFRDTNAFKIGTVYYLHNAEFTYMSLWGWYWLNKYIRWFEQNINIAELPKYTI